MQRKEINFNVYFEKVCIMNSFVFFSHISLVINLYFIGLLRISKKLLSYIFSEIINLIHNVSWTRRFYCLENKIIKYIKYLFFEFLINFHSNYTTWIWKNCNIYKYVDPFCKPSAISFFLLLLLIALEGYFFTTWRSWQHLRRVGDWLPWSFMHETRSLRCDQAMAMVEVVEQRSS